MHPVEPTEGVSHALYETTDPGRARGRLRRFGVRREDLRRRDHDPGHYHVHHSNPLLRPGGYMTFAINVHDWRHIDESADTLLRAIGIFEKQGVRGDFYLTGEMANRYAERRPDVVERLRSSGMTISYHVRPPQRTYAGFGDALKRLSDAQLLQTVKDYETYRLDMATGGLIRGAPGGYSFVAELFGRAPVVASAQSSDPRIRETVLSVYKSMGAKMAVFYHEEGTKLDRPFEWRSGLLARPSDFSITRWREDSLTAKQGESSKDPFWWNFIETPHAAAYNPAAYLERRMSEWTASRPAFVTSLIHENNFPRSGQSHGRRCTSPTTERPGPSPRRMT